MTDPPPPGEWGKMALATFAFYVKQTPNHGHGGCIHDVNVDIRTNKPLNFISASAFHVSFRYKTD